MQKCVGDIFVDFNICYRAVSLQKLYYVNLNYFLKVKNYKKIYISETVKASAKMCVDFGICHQMVSLRKLYSVILTYFLKVKIKKILSVKRVGDIGSLWHLPSNGVIAKNCTT